MFGVWQSTKPPVAEGSEKLSNRWHPCLTHSTANGNPLVVNKGVGNVADTYNIVWLARKAGASIQPPWTIPDHMTSTWETYLAKGAPSSKALYPHDDGNKYLFPTTLAWWLWGSAGRWLIVIWKLPAKIRGPQILPLPWMTTPTHLQKNINELNMQT